MPKKNTKNSIAPPPPVPQSSPPMEQSNRNLKKTNSY